MKTSAILLVVLLGGCAPFGPEDAALARLGPETHEAINEAVKVAVENERTELKMEIEVELSKQFEDQLGRKPLGQPEEPEVRGRRFFWMTVGVVAAISMIWILLWLLFRKSK